MCLGSKVNFSGKTGQVWFGIIYICIRLQDYTADGQNLKWIFLLNYYFMFILE